MQTTRNIYLKMVIVFIILFVSISIQAKRYTINPFIKSALIPGWGQVSLNHPYGYGMMTSEVLLWSGYLYNKNEQDLKDNASYDYAIKYSHINPAHYSAQYYRDLTKYDSSGFSAGGYNAMIRQQAIQLYPSDPTAQQEYINANAYSEEMSWSWDSYQLRKKYSTMRKDLLELKDQAQLFTGLLIANHIISGVDMLRQRKHWGDNVHTSVQYYRNSPALFMNVDF